MLVKCFNILIIFHYALQKNIFLIFTQVNNFILFHGGV